jgi:hypothetical protein
VRASIPLTRRARPADKRINGTVAADPKRPVALSRWRELRVGPRARPEAGRAARLGRLVAGAQHDERGVIEVQLGPALLGRAEHVALLGRAVVQPDCIAL